MNCGKKSEKQKNTEKKEKTWWKKDGKKREQKTGKKSGTKNEKHWKKNGKTHIKNRVGVLYYGEGLLGIGRT